MLGAGGMGEVYQATDSKLGRSVAIKLLPDAFARDNERVARFEREARVLASLNHPNIAGIHGLEEHDSRRFLIMELVAGETLAERIKKGPIPVDEALGIAKQICEALEAAHDRGVIHRDLKPANIKITPDGKVKVLDFGLAKAMAPMTSDANLSNSPTMLSMAATNGGVILGTAAYMAPEQAKGKEVDKRADIFAFGCVLYEMLTATPAFEGEDVTEILGRVVTAQANLDRLPPPTPQGIRRLLSRTLKKDPRQRLADIHDAKIEIEEALAGVETPANAPSASSSASKARLAWSLAVAALIAAGALGFPAARYFRQTAPSEMRLEITTPPTTRPTDFALSPDGRSIVFSVTSDGVPRLWLRGLDKTDAQPLPGTEGATVPFWSADSRSIAFSARGFLYRLDLRGGAPETITRTIAGATNIGAWNASGTILFSPGTASAIARIQASGGASSPVTQLAATQGNHRFPQFLPDGNHFFFFVYGNPEVSGLYLSALSDGSAKRLTGADSFGINIPPGWAAFVEQGRLVARRFDLKRGELTGDPVTLANGIAVGAGGVAGLSVSTDGKIAYRSGTTAPNQLRWFDHGGKPAGNPISADGVMTAPELSPDERTIAVDRTVQNNRDVWLIDAGRNAFTRLTFDPAQDNFPVWSPDGKRIAFVSNRKVSYDLYTKPSNGAGGEELLLSTPYGKVPLDWSSDGRYLLYSEADPTTGRDLWALDLTATDRKPFPVVHTPFEEPIGAFSPDGRWIAYQTTESGRFEIVVQAFPSAAGKWQVSTAGGTQPRWRADGKELYFIAPDRKMMAAAVSVSGATFQAGTLSALFATQTIADGNSNLRQQYALSRDGRFLIDETVETAMSTPITILLNWKPPQ